MNDSLGPVSEDDLTAYVDGRLPADRTAALDRFLEANPAARTRVLDDQAVRDSLRQRLAPIANLPIPDRLRASAILARRRSLVRRRAGMAAASVVLLLGGGIGGWVAHDLAQRPSQAAVSATAVDAISAHRVFVVEKVHPVEVGAAQEAHLVQWLSRRVGHTLSAPDLAGQGYVLMGGRLLPAGNEPAAQFMYENGSGHRLTVYVRVSGGDDTQFRFVASQGLSAFSWIDQGLGFAIVGALDRGQLLEMADAVYQQLDPQHRVAPAAL